MKNSNQKAKHVRNVLDDFGAQGGTLMHNSGYINLCMSPAAAREKAPQDKLAICMTAKEWTALDQALGQLSPIIAPLFSDGDTIKFLRAVIHEIVTDQGHDLSLNLNVRKETL